MADTKIPDNMWAGYDVEAHKAGKKQPDVVFRKPGEELNKDAFLKLMLTQLQYQDPLSPADNKDMLAQMAQMTSIEQMKNMSGAFVNSQAYGLIGKDVKGSVLNEKTNAYDDVIGTVSAVKVKKGESYLIVDGKEMAVNRVTDIVDSFATGLNSIGNSMTTSQSMALVGKTIQAITLNEKGEPVKFIEGKVEYVKFDSSGNPILVVGNEEIYPKEVLSISDKDRLIGKDITLYHTDKDGKKQKIEGRIDGVNFIGGKPHLEVGGKQFEVANIGLITDALKYVGQQVDFKGDSGVVLKVSITAKLPYLELDSGDIVSFADFKGVNMEKDGE